MPKLLLLPFRAPSDFSVQSRIRLISPATEFDDLPQSWDPLIDIVVGAEVIIYPSFLTETGLSTADPLTLTLTADCTPARGRWIARQTFTWQDGQATASTQLEIPGQEIGGFLRLYASVVGDAETGDPDPDRSRHPFAKLWTSDPVRASLDQPDRYPTSTVSFSERNWPSVPWTVRCTDALEPDAHLTVAMRVYLNADLPEGRALAAGEASHSIAAAVQADVLEELFDRLSRMDSDHVVQASEQPESDMSMAAVGNYNAERRLGISMLDALEWAREEPRRLKETIREKTQYLREAQT